MFEKFLSSNARDFSQRYQGTYGYFTRNGKKTLVNLSRVDPEAGVVTFMDKDGTPYHLYQDAADDTGFEFLPPVNCWHNTPLGPLLVRRIAQKQYRRGICEGNTSITNIDARAVPIDFANLIAIYDSKVTAKESLVKKSAAAISPQFTVDLKNKRAMLYNSTIGEATGNFGEVKITLRDREMWGVEVNDALRRSGINGVVQ